ncbi:hypothetical protein [uncultured Algimonas sp.]|uniref:lipoyl protein ligase domain-containing protein n=1 Tax=uncultured Algimonas sp. TaxID=1547920 RepID=UPI00261B4CDC|nr:hypothetical protein [uncultured Algimonas sp.]
MPTPFPLKSVSGSLDTLTASVRTPSPGALPPRDGAVLQSVYDREAHHMRRMRDGSAPALWYDWVPQAALSVSGREHGRLGDIDHFTAEPVAIRGTGGTVVPQGPGTINISVLSRHPRHPGIRETYAALCEALRQGFAAMGLETTTGARPGSFCDGDHNILLEGRKLVGTAQRWALAPDGGAVCLHHCVILSGGSAETLCARAEALYAHAGRDVRYDRDAHSAVPLDRAALGAAMEKPLRAYIVRSEEDRL